MAVLRILSGQRVQRGPFSASARSPPRSRPAFFDVTTFHWGAALNVAVLATLGALAKGLLAREHLLPVPAATAGPAAAGGGAGPATPVEPSPSTLPLVTYREATGR
jgi:hypothetical protein